MESNRLVCTKRANDTVIMVGLLSLGVVVGASIAKKDGEELWLYSYPFGQMSYCWSISFKLLSQSFSVCSQMIFQALMTRIFRRLFLAVSHTTTIWASTINCLNLRFSELLFQSSSGYKVLPD